MKKLFYVVTFVLFLSGITFASFPVKTNEKAQITSQVQKNELTTASKSITIEAGHAKITNSKTPISAKTATKSDNDLIILLALWFFLGFFAAHRWYAGKPVVANILFIITGGGCGIWAIIDLVRILQGNFMK